MTTLLVILAIVGIVIISIRQRKKAKARSCKIEEAAEAMKDMSKLFNQGDWEDGEVEAKLNSIKSLISDIPGTDIRDVLKEHKKRST